MKTLLLDIETAPNLAYVWGTFKQNVTMDKIVDNGHVLCFTAKWLGHKDVTFERVDGTKRSVSRMLDAAHTMIEEADVVIHYNGKAFDVPTLNREFLLHDFAPPAPYKQIDLLEVVRDRFNFPINKMDYVCRRLGIPGKVKHAGFQMWVDCMAGDEAAWSTMESYNRHDVTMLERLYEKLRPWVKNHPNVGAYDDRPDACPHCGEEGTLQKRGMVPGTKRHRYQCRACGAWSQDIKAGAKTAATVKALS